MKSLNDLFAYAKRQARINTLDYGTREAWQQDKTRRDSDRKKVMSRYGFLGDTPLMVGRSSNGRLTVDANDFDYTAGQYPPTEIWGAVYSYLENTYSLSIN